MTVYHIRVKLFNKNGFLLRDGVIKHDKMVPCPLIRMGNLTFMCVNDGEPKRGWYSYIQQSDTLSNCHVVDNDFGLVEETVVRTDYVPVESAHLISIDGEYVVLAKNDDNGTFIIKNDRGNLMAIQPDSCPVLLGRGWIVTTYQVPKR